MATPTGVFKPVTISLLSTTLDTQSAPRDMSSMAMRIRENFLGIDSKFTVAPGFERFLGDRNQDLHDQLLPVQFYYGDLEPQSPDAGSVVSWPSDSCQLGADGENPYVWANGREVVTMLLPITSSRGGKFLFIGTQSRIYELNETTGNYRLIIDGMGGPPKPDLSIRWRGFQIGDTVIFTNGYDKPIAYELGARASGCFMRPAKFIPQLEDMKVFYAVDGVENKGSGLLAAPNIGGIDYSDYILWSDFNSAQRWKPLELITTEDPIAGTRITGKSIANYQSLGGGRRIKRLLNAGNFIYVFTDRDIWRGVATGDADQAFAFQIFFSPKEGESLPMFFNQILTLSDVIYYPSSDGMYKIDLYSPWPEKVEWLTKAAWDFITKANQEACNVHCCCVDGNTNTAYFSYADGTNLLPNRTFIFNTDEEFPGYLDYGMTAYAMYKPAGGTYTLRDLLREICACDDTGDTAFVKEGIPASNTACPFLPEYIVSAETVEFEDMTVENYDGAPGALSICAALSHKTVADFCSRPCDSGSLFIGASSADWCIKQIGLSFSREFCTNANLSASLSAEEIESRLRGFGYITTEGEYNIQGYTPSLVMGPIQMGTTEAKTCNYMEVELEASVNQIARGFIAFRVGESHVAIDALKASASCDISWEKFRVKELKCPQKFSAQKMKEERLRPVIGIEAPFLTKGRYLYVEIKIGNLADPDNLKSTFLPGLGCEAALSTMMINVMKSR